MSKSNDKSSLDFNNAIEKWGQKFDRIVRHEMDRLEKVELEREKIQQEFIKMKDEISSQYTKIIENVFKVNDEDLANSLQSVMEEEGNNSWLPDDIERQLIRSAVIVVYD